MSKQLKITFTGGGNLGEDFRLDLDGKRLLGRTHTADVVVSESDIDVSGKHLEFESDGAGAAVRCVSRHGFHLNGEKVNEGESRPLKRGDEIKIGKRVRIRVDRIGPAEEGDAAGGAATFATRAVEDTLATRPVGGGTIATRAVGGETFATRVADTAFGDSFAEAPVGEAASVMPTRFSVSGGTADDDAVTVQDATSGGMTAPVAPGADASSYSDSGTFGGETQAMATRVGNMDVIRAIAEEKERVKRFRQRMVTVAAFGTLAVLGALAYWRWPRAERWLQHPRPIVQHTVAGSTGVARLFVDYPKCSRTRTSERANGGIDVETLTGKARDVPFRLSLDIRRDAPELDLSLEKSVERELTGLGRQGYLFDPVGTDGGYGFFEWDYPKSCENGGTQRGVRFYRREFTRSDGTGQWHGILLYFRDVDTAYRLLREIPDPEWPRGQWLLREDPSIALYAGFLAQQWESPGAEELADYTGREPSELFKAVDAALERNLPSEWKEISRMIDVLLLVGFKGDADVLAEARSRLERLREAKRLFYEECESRRDCGDGDEAFVRCWGAFGNDASDLRCRRLSNPDEWRRK